MSTGNIKLWWKVKKQPDSFNIYHSLEKFSATDLPAPLASGLAAPTRDFRHTGQLQQINHYYRIASVKDGKLYISRGIMIKKKPYIWGEWQFTTTSAENGVATINATRSALNA